MLDQVYKAAYKRSLIPKISSFQPNELKSGKIPQNHLTMQFAAVSLLQLNEYLCLLLYFLCIEGFNWAGYLQ